MPSLILASGSPIRRRLLADAGLVFEVRLADIAEERLESETAWQMADRLALQKARAVAAKCPDAWVIGCDQTGQTDAGVELRKCWDQQAALTQLCSMSGRSHTFRSAAALVRGDEVVAQVAQEATIRFRAFERVEAEAYLRSGQWEGAAGSYTLEGRGAQLVDAVEGSHHAVFGLPLLPLLAALRHVVAMA